LVREHQAGVWRYLRALGCETVLAEDLAQEVFLKALTKPWPVAAGNSGQEFAYLKTCARNLAIDHWRKHRRERPLGDFDHASDAWEAEVGASDGEEEVAALRECLRGVQGRARQLIDMRYRDDVAMSEGAAQLGMTEGAAKVALQRARDQLRECMKRRLRGSATGREAKNE